MACEIIAAVKKRVHISGLKRFVVDFVKVGRDARKIEIDPVTLGDGVDTIEVTDPLILDQRRDRTCRNRKNILADGLPFGIDFPVSNDI